MTFNSDSKFDIQLSAAKVAERKLAEIFAAAKIEKIELKTETYQWRRTGNICIEYAQGGRPSGIAVTQADYWVHELRDDDGGTVVYLMFPVARLKRLTRKAYNEGRHFTNGGDNQRMSGVLLSVRELMDLMHTLNIGSGAR